MKAFCLWVALFFLIKSLIIAGFFAFVSGCLVVLGALAVRQSPKI